MGAKSLFLYSSTTQNSWVLRIEIRNRFLSILINKPNTDYLLYSISCRLPRTHTKIPEFSRCSNCHKAMVLDNHSRPRACSSLSSLTHLLLPPHHTVTPHLPTMPEALGACRFTTGFRNDRVFLKSQRYYLSPAAMNSSEPGSVSPFFKGGNTNDTLFQAVTYLALRDAATMSPVWQAVRGTLQQCFSTNPSGWVYRDPVIQAWGTNQSQALRRQAWMKQPAAVSRSRRQTTCGSVKFINTAHQHLLLQ